MSTAQELLSSALDSGGWICIFIQKGKIRRQKFFAPGEYQQAADFAEAQDKGGFNCYFCTSTLKDGSNRTAANVNAVKVVKLDLDVDPYDQRKFNSREEALRDLREFCRKVHLPKPTVVSSGGGFHVYWILSWALDAESGRAVLDRVKALTIHHGFKADPTTTADIARVLRLPGTHNHKDPANPKPVVLMAPIAIYDTDQICDVIEQAPLPTGAVVPALFSDADITHLQQEDDAATKALAGEDKEFHSLFSKLLRMSQEGKGCTQVVRLWNSRHTAGEEDWRDLLGLAKFNDDGAEAIHLVSKDHPDYGFTDCVNKAEKIPKPFLCSHFQSGIHKASCEGCKHIGKIKTPLVLGQYVPKATAEDNVIVAQNKAIDSAPRTYVIPDLPPPYFRAKHGGIYRKSDDDEIPDTLISKKDFYAVSNLREQNNDLMIELCVNNGLDGLNQFVLPLSDLNSDAFKRVLPAKGVTPPNVRAGFMNLQQYVQDAHEFIQRTKPAVPVKYQFGWTEGYRSFVIGEREIVHHDDGSITVEYSQPSASLGSTPKKFGWKGTLEAWKNTIHAYDINEHMAPHRFGVLLGFAAPLMSLMSQKGVVINLFGEASGHGKTTVLKAQATMWGSPSCMLQYGDTENSRYQVMGVYKNIPVTVDEMTDVPPEKFKAFLFNTSQGRGKERMEGHTNTLRENNSTWETLVTTSSNTCYAEALRVSKTGNEGEMMRLMEVEFGENQRDLVSKADADLLFSALNDNYGHAGEVFIRHVMTVGVDEVRKNLRAVQRDFDKALNMGNKHRFWSATVTAAYVAGVMAKEIGLIDFDMDEMNGWMKSLIGGLQKTQRAHTETADKSSLVSDFISENYGHLIKLRALPDGSTVKDIPKDKIIGRMDTKADGEVELIVMRSALDSFLAARNVHVRGFLNAMASVGAPVVEARVRLMSQTDAAEAGAHGAVFAQRVYRIVMSS